MSNAEIRHQTLAKLVALIREEWEKLGWSKYRLANESGVSLPGICLIEDGQRMPGFVTLFLLADAMKLRLRDVVNLADNVPPERKKPAEEA